MKISFTARELDVMAVLWERGSGTVTEVRDALAGDFAYTTVLTVLRTLEEKGYVSHVSEGKAHRYKPEVEPDIAGRSAVARIVDTMFAGSPELLLTQLVADRSISAESLRRMRDLLETHLESGEDK